jgi:hypothetical protein
LFTTPPDPNQLGKDIESVKKDDPVVEKLAALRGNFVAHINWKNTTGNLKIGDRFALTFQEIDLLISRAVAILNRYSILFKRMLGQTPYLGVMISRPFSRCCDATSSGGKPRSQRRSNVQRRLRADQTRAAERISVSAPCTGPSRGCSSHWTPVLFSGAFRLWNSSHRRAASSSWPWIMCA